MPDFVPFPTDALPKAAADLVRAGADSLQVDPGMLGPLVLATMASAVGNSRTIALHASWHEPAIIWAVVVAPSGSGKSPALELVTRPAERVGLVDDEGAVEFPLTQQHIADALGLSLVHTNKTLRKLERVGLHEIAAGRLRLLQPQALERIADYSTRPMRKLPLI